jgi:hypothetical protein
VHFHVAGTLEEGGTMWGEVPKLSVAETDAIAERLRQVEASLQHLAGQRVGRLEIEDEAWGPEVA